MPLIKCPRCELNYIKDTEKFCPVCRKEMKGEIEPDEILDLCPECNEFPPVAGQDLCALCLKEKRRLEQEEANLLQDPNADDVENENEEFPPGTMEEVVLPDSDDKDAPPVDLMDEIQEAFGENEVESDIEPFEDEMLDDDEDEIEE